MEKRSPFEWPFAYHRQTWISDADQIMDKCADDLVEVEHVVAPLTPKSVRQQKRLARKLARAADLYKLAGLGLLAARCWRYSASIYDKLSDETLRQHMLELADAVPDQAF